MSSNKPNERDKLSTAVAAAYMVTDLSEAETAAELRRCATVIEERGDVDPEEVEKELMRLEADDE